LWSHYGDRHRGVALEPEIDDDLVEEVQYSLAIAIDKKLAEGGGLKEDACRIAIKKSALEV
jgi:hypothetical protein